MKFLGNNIKELRNRRHLTLADVAQRTGIDVASLSRIENGRMTGTIESHLAIAKALEVRLPDLYEKAIEAEEKLPKPKDESKSSGVFAHSGGSVSELLTSNVLQKKMMPVLLKLKGNAKTVLEEMPLGAERFVYVISGKLELTIRNEAHAIETGESMYFNASMPHRFANKLKNPCICLIVTSPVSL